MVATACPCWSENSAMSSPKRARRRDSISGTGRGRGELATPLLPDVLACDLLLELDDPVQERLRSRWTARNVHVRRDDLVDALRDRVGVPVRPAAVGAGPERDHVLRVRDLVVDALEGRRHLV